MPALCVSIVIAPTIILHVQYCGKKKPMEHLAVVTACIKSTVKNTAANYCGAFNHSPRQVFRIRTDPTKHCVQFTPFITFFGLPITKTQLPAGAKENCNSTFTMWSLHYLSKTMKTMSVHLSSVSRCICIDLLSIRLSLYADSATKQNRLTFAWKYGHSRERQGHLF